MMTAFRRGYIDGLHGNVVENHFTTRKSYRLYHRGYAKGLGVSYLKILLKQTEK